MSIIKKINDKEQVLADKSVIDHSQLTNRDAYGAHPISAIRKLPEKLSKLKEQSDSLSQQITQERTERIEADEELNEYISNVEFNAEKINVEEAENGKLKITTYGGATKEVQSGYLPDEDLLTLDAEDRLTVKQLYIDEETISGTGLDANEELSAIAIKQGDIKYSATDIQSEFARIDSKDQDQDGYLDRLAAKIDALEGTGGYLEPYNFGKADLSSAEDQEEITNIAMQQIFDDPSQHDKTEIWNGTRIKNLFNDHIWILNNTPDTQPPIFEWIDDGLDTVGIATNDSLGVVKGSIEDWKASIDVNGQISINGLESYKNQVDEYIEEFQSNIEQLTESKANKSELPRMVILRAGE